MLLVLKFEKNNCRHFSVVLQKSYKNCSKSKRRRQEYLAYISMKIEGEIENVFYRNAQGKKLYKPYHRGGVSKDECPGKNNCIFGFSMVDNLRRR